MGARIKNKEKFASVEFKPTIPVSEKTIKANFELAAEYRESINQLVLGRFRIVAPLTMPLIVLFTFLDRIVYPSQAALFLEIRLLCCAILIVFYALSFHSKMRKHAISLINASLLILVLTMLAFIYLTEGAQSRYYQGINLAIMAMLLVNSFYYWNSIVMFVVFFLLYTFVSIASPAGWNTMGYLFGSFFMISNSILVVIMTWLYERQYRQTFNTNIKLKKLFSQADELSKIDDLTKIYNRRHFMQLLEEKMERSRISQTTFFVVFFDVDHFKEVNDTHGHVFGDTVLKTVVDRVRSKIRITNLVGRYGGDEFMFFLDLSDSESFFDRVRPIQQVMKDISLTHQGKKVSISVSFGGVKVKPGRFRNVTEITDAADRAMLEVKKTQRGGVRLVE